MATHSSVFAWRIPGTGSLVGCRLWGCTESDTTEATQQQQQQHCSSTTEILQTDFPILRSHHHCPQARDRSSYWTHHLDVLILCGMIYRKAASITIYLTVCVDEMLKTQNCQDGTVHSLRHKQLSANSLRHTHAKKAAAPKTKTQSISLKDGKTRGCFPESEKWPRRNCPLSNTGNALLFLLAGAQRQPPVWAKQFQEWQPADRNRENKKINLHMDFYFQPLFTHSNNNKKMKPVTEIKTNRPIYLLALVSLLFCQFETGDNSMIVLHSTGEFVEIAYPSAPTRSEPGMGQREGTVICFIGWQNKEHFKYKVILGLTTHRCSIIFF